MNDACYQIISHELSTVPIIKYFSIRNRKFCPNVSMLTKGFVKERILDYFNSFARGFTVTKHL